MTIYNITNDPFQRRRVTFSKAWWTEAFTADDLDNFENYCNNFNLQTGAVVDNNKDETVNTHRESKICFIDKNEENTWIFDKFNYVIDSLNNSYFNFNLYGYKSFQYTVYDSASFGHYNWHIDTILDNQLPDSMLSESTRKLTVIMLLNEPGVDFTGGEFQLNTSMEEKAETLEMQRGKIFVFPSFLIHRVKPVLTGIRKSIVIWVEGPKFV